MIVFDLKCSKGHVFEAWFKDGATFERQAANGEIACAVCGDTRIAKAPMAPSVHGSSKRDRDAEAKADAMKMLRQLRAKVESECEYVGDRFANEARAIHDGDAPKRGIYGEATLAETKELQDDGVEVTAIPWAPLEN